jgi:ABC-type Fe3+ transport system substrate-binding protein
LEAIKENDPILTQTNSEAFTFIVSGEASVGIGLLNDYLSALETGLPIGAIWTNPTYTPVFPWVATANSPHPNMARLWMEWFLSVSGQKALAETGRTPANSVVAAATILAGVLPPNTTLETVSNEDFFENSDSWVSKYQNLGY